MRFLPHILLVAVLTLSGLLLYKLGQSDQRTVCAKEMVNHEKNIVKKTVAANKTRQSIIRNSVNGAIDERVRKFYIE